MLRRAPRGETACGKGGNWRSKWRLEKAAAGGGLLERGCPEVEPHETAEAALQMSCSSWGDSGFGWHHRCAFVSDTPALVFI